MPACTTALDRWIDQWLADIDAACATPSPAVWALLRENKRIWLAHMQAQNEECEQVDATSAAPE